MTAPWVDALLAWFQHRARDLPWRRTRDPYAIWVAEVMLQQTRTETVLNYYVRWMKRFPTVQALAQASPDEVLALWEGLGYYRRALNLLEAARAIVAHFGGRLPQDPEILESLPGIGPYTARAVASIAFGKDVAVLDGNVRRVLARFFALEAFVDTREGETLLWNLAQQHLPRGQAGTYNQALMELGARVCLPRKPQCAVCPVRPWCRAYASGDPTQWPRKRPRKAVPLYTVVAGVLVREGRVLLAQRPQGGLLGGLWEFPGGKVENGESLDMALRREWQEELGVQVDVAEPLGTYRHAYSHFRIILHAFQVLLAKGEPHPKEGQRIAWVPIATLASYPMGKVDRQIARRVQAKFGPSSEASEG